MLDEAAEDQEGKRAARKVSEGLECKYTLVGGWTVPLHSRLLSRESVSARVVS
jgi:hypothetical protein